jgi:uncharacterized membrane protein
MRHYTRHWNNWQKLLVGLLVLGVFLRFFNIDRQVYWYDETMTSLRISGHTEEELMQEVYTGEPITVGELHQEYQYPNPTEDWQAVFEALGKHSEHSPLYYVLARWWHQIFGNSVAILRTLSALLGVLVLPGVYWLGRELFANKTVPWVAMALVAISPFHVLYAKEAREYSLWTLSIVLSSAALLRALRLHRDRASNDTASDPPSRTKLGWAWALYALLVALAFYAHPFSGLVVLGHGIFVVVTESPLGKQGWQRIGVAFVAAVTGLVLFLPWMLVMIDNFSTIAQNTISTSIPRPNLHLIWGLNLSRIFFDVNQGTSPLNPILYLLIALTVYSIYYVCRHAPPRTWIFLITLMGVLGLALIVPDVVAGGRRSSITRYGVPSYLGIQLAVSYLLTYKVTQAKKYSRLYRRWRTIGLALVFVGVVSCFVASFIPVWWHKSYAKSRYHPELSAIINSASQPVVLSNDTVGMVLSLTHSLRDDVAWQLFVDQNFPQIPSRYQDVFAYRFSDEDIAQFERQTNSELVEAFEEGWLWKQQPASRSEEN